MPHSGHIREGGGLALEGNLGPPPHEILLVSSRQESQEEPEVVAQTPPHPQSVVLGDTVRINQTRCVHAHLAATVFLTAAAAAAAW